jgi:hypothetical protein
MQQKLGLKIARACITLTTVLWEIYAWKGLVTQILQWNTVPCVDRDCGKQYLELKEEHVGMSTTVCSR